MRRQRLDARDDLSRIAADRIGQLGQNAGDLLLLGQLKLAPLIVQLDNRDRLDIQRRAAGRLIVNQAANIALVRCLHRHDIAAVAHGNDRLLQRIAILSSS